MQSYQYQAEEIRQQYNNMIAAKDYEVVIRIACVKILIREIKIHAYGKRQTADWSWEFLKLENKQIKLSRTILTDKTGVKLLIFQ